MIRRDVLVAQAVNGRRGDTVAGSERARGRRGVGAGRGIGVISEPVGEVQSAEVRGGSGRA
jgi:hypothetical protein